MSIDYHSELAEIDSAISRLESKLATVDSEHRREMEALELRHRESKERLNSSLSLLKSARDTLREDGDPREPTDSSSTPPKTAARSGSSSNGHIDTGMKPQQNGGFSIRWEIKKLLPELDPWRDVVQGDMTRILRALFPERSGTIHAATVSSALRRLAHAGDLVLVSKGSGSEPNRYRRPGFESEKQEELGEMNK